jgi:cytoskeletal protein CcmA (bactofilin family)
MPGGKSPPCVLKSGAEFSGLLQLTAPGRIDGRVDGEVIASDLLWIGGSARVRARVTAPEIIVAGALEGEAHASDRIELLGSARVTAALDTPRLVLAEGSFFQGRCRTDSGSGVEVADSGSDLPPPAF